MKVLNTWQVATATNGSEIKVKLVPLKRQQNTNQGVIWVEVGHMIQLESGEIIPMNLDGLSFYTGVNQLYRLNESDCDMYN